MEKMSPNAWLRGELAKRQSANQRYSLRSFAKTVKVSPGRVSEWITDKREISLASVQAITKRLGYSPSESVALLGALFQGKIKERLSEEQNARHLLLNDQFQLVKEPYHYALMELILTKGFKEDASWIAKRLQLTETQVRSGLERLLRVGLLRRNSKKQLEHAHGGTTTTQDVPSEALKASHRITLKDAIEALEKVPVEDRDITSITMAIDTAKIPLAKQMIRDFRRRCADVLSSGSKDEVYHLNVQLVPASFHCNEKKQTTTKKE